jgi:hypothetical protein
LYKIDYLSKIDFMQVGASRAKAAAVAQSSAVVVLKLERCVAARLDTMPIPTA